MKWALKIMAKLLMARIPAPYAFWKSIGVFRHGRMDSTDYPIRTFNLHVHRAFTEGLPQGATILELGPGDSVASALLGFASGTARTYLVDVGSYAKREICFYRSLAADMGMRGMKVPDLSAAASIEDILNTCNAEYFTDGISSLQLIPSRSVDFVWSHSVLEHVRRRELETLLHELRRILKPSALSSHNIDYQDHLDHALNNLRFSGQVWESSLFADSGFYTNRVPAVRMHALFREAGFEILQEAFGAWPALPTPRKSMHRDFLAYRDAELLNRTSHVLLKA